MHAAVAIPDERGASPGSDQEASFLQAVVRLANRGDVEDAAFRQTPAPFTRLREVLGRMGPDQQVAAHPSRCQEPTCQSGLSDHYYRRADGFVLCPACFQRSQAGDPAALESPDGGQGGREPR